MESYDVDTPELISEDWYLNTDSFFSIIAYRDPGASYPIIPKNRGEKFLTIKEFEKLSQDFKFNFSINNNSSDTIKYYTYPRIVIKYPLQIGSSWNELRTPFYRDRIVKDITSLQINNKTYQCYVIEADVQEYKMKMIDYINLKAGLLKREIIADSLAITSPDSPDSITGYAFGHDVSILVNKILST